MGVVTKGKRDNTQVRLRWPDGSHSRWYLIHKLEEPPTPLTHLAETMAAAEAARAAEEEAREKGSQGTAGAAARAGAGAGQEPEPEPEPQAGGARAGGLLGADITAPEDATTDNSVWLPDHILAYALFLVRVRHRKNPLRHRPMPFLESAKSVLKLPSVCWLTGTAARPR